MTRTRHRFLLASIAAALILSCIHSPARAADAVRSQPYTWKSVVIEGGGFVSGIVMHPKVPGLTYVRTDIGGAYRRDSAADKWIPLTDWVGMQDGNLLGCESLAIDPNDPDRLYLALGTYVAPWASNGVIARSSDRGKTFQLTPMPFKMGANNNGRTVGERLMADPNDGRILFFGSRTDGLWRSQDFGATWSSVDTFPQSARHASDLGISFVAFDSSTGHAGSPTPILYAGICTHDASLFRSTDAGNTWHEVPGAPRGFMPIHAVIAPDHQMYIPYGDQPGPGEMSDGALWRFNTQTGEWKNISPVKPGVLNDGNDHFGYAGIAVSATHPNIIMTTTFCRWNQGDSVFRSTDGGDTWSEEPMRKPDPHATLFQSPSAPYAANITPHWISTIVIDPFDPDHATFTTGFGMWSTNDAGNLGSSRPVRWTFDNRGLEEIADFELKSPPAGAHLVSAIGDYDGFRHDDLDHSPPHRHEPSVGSTSALDFAGQKPFLFVRAGSDGRGFLSADGAESWRPFAGKPDDAKEGGTMALSADGAAIEWTPGRGRQWFSHDAGATWRPCEGLPGGIQVISDRVSAHRFFAFDPNTGILYRSDDGAAHFSQSCSGLPRGRLFASPAGDLWLASEQRGLERSRNAGALFLPVPGMPKCWTLGFGKAAPGKKYPALYAVGQLADTTGVFRSDDEGRHWTRINDDQHQYGWIGRSIAGDPRLYGRVYLGTNGRGILYADPAAPTPHNPAAR